MTESANKPAIETPTEAPYDNWNWRADPVTPGGIALVDIDGVISDGNHRQHLLEGDKKDWDTFFDQCDQDAPITDVMTMVNNLDPALGIILLTARPHRLREKTLEWLSRQDLRWDALILRGKRDARLRSPQFKQRTVRQLRKHDYEPVVAFDDDMRNVEVFRAEDVPTVYIHSGYYEV